MTVGISVVTPVYRPPLDIFRETARSVLDQSSSDWEWVLVDDASRDPELDRFLDELASSDRRISVIRRPVNGGIVAASNDGLAAARGEFIALLDHDDLLVPHALETMARTIAEYPDVDYLYSDEDKVDSAGNFSSLFIKPDWSPERLRHQMYTCHLSVIRAETARAVGGFHDGFDGSQDHDLVLRVTERARRVVHVPEVLYHWRVMPGSTAQSSDAKPYAWEAGRRAVQAHLERVGLDATADFGPIAGMYRVRRSVADLPRVSLVMPTRGASGLVWGERRNFAVEALRTALRLTWLTDVEVVVVYDQPEPAGFLDELRAVCGDRLVTVPFTQPFNFSEKCNLGFLTSSGDIVVFLNDDIEACSEHWLEELVTPLLEPDVGMTGAKLLFADGTIQHGGHTYDQGEMGHAYFRSVPDLALGFGALEVNREVSGVTAACAAVRRDVFEEVGGFTEILPLNFNDVDLSRKIRSRGYRILWMAQAVLYHFESRTRDRHVGAYEVELVAARWGRPVRDPFLPEC